MILRAITLFSRSISLVMGKVSYHPRRGGSPTTQSWCLALWMLSTCNAPISLLIPLVGGSPSSSLAQTQTGWGRSYWLIVQVSGLRGQCNIICELFWPKQGSIWLDVVADWEKLSVIGYTPLSRQETTSMPAHYVTLLPRLSMRTLLQYYLISSHRLF